MSLVLLAPHQEKIKIEYLLPQDHLFLKNDGLASAKVVLELSFRRRLPDGEKRLLHSSL